MIAYRPILTAMALCLCGGAVIVAGTVVAQEADPSFVDELPDVGLPPQPEPEAAGLESRTPPPPSQFQLNRHYRHLSPTQPVSSSPNQVEIAVLFSYRCAECRAVDADLVPVSVDRTSRLSFVRIPIVDDELDALHARAFYTAERLGQVDTLHAAVYREILELGNLLDSEEALRALFARQGITATVFDNAFQSPQVSARVLRAAELRRRYRVSGVPAVVINGRYTTGLQMAGGRDTMLRVVEELVAREVARN